MFSDPVVHTNTMHVNQLRNKGLADQVKMLVNWRQQPKSFKPHSTEGKKQIELFVDFNECLCSIHFRYLFTYICSQSQMKISL